MKETDKAWVAAMIDSRAHIVKKQNRDRQAGSEQICLVLQTKHHEIALRLCAMTGTEPRHREQKKVSPELMRRQCAEHCPEAHVHVDTLAAMPLVTTWTVTGVSAAIVLWNVRKYMATSREPWDWAMEQSLRQMKLAGQGSGMTRAAAIRLQDLGWDLPLAIRKVIPRELEAAR